VKRLPALAAAATVLLTITACGSSTPGTALPTTSTATSTATGNGNNSGSDQPNTTTGGGTGKITSTNQLYNTQACTLLTATEATQLDLPSTGEISNDGAKSGCGWDGTEYSVSVHIRTDVGISGVVNANGGTLTPTTVGSHQAMRLQDDTGWCMYAMRITDGSRVDVGALGNGQPSCQEALTAAKIVEQKLP
jgi:uncharacterized protein DUF3558